MQTMRLFAYQNPSRPMRTASGFSRPEMSLELSRERGCPALHVGSYEMDGKLKVWQLWALERLAMQAQRCLQVWVAWTEELITWFVVAEMAAVPGPHGRGEAIRMFFYDEDGRRVSWGTWALQSDRSWMLCER